MQIIQGENYFELAQDVDAGTAIARFTLKADASIEIAQRIIPKAPSLSSPTSDGRWRYKITFVTPNGESEPSFASEAGDLPQTLTLPPASKLVTTRKIYRSQENGVAYFLLATVTDAAATTYVDASSSDSVLDLDTEPPVASPEPDQLATITKDGTMAPVKGFIPPTTDPGISGAVWNDGGTLRVVP